MSFASPQLKPSSKSPLIQTKLTIGQPNDKYEQEADAMADQVMRMPQSSSPIQRKCEDCEEEKLQMKPLSSSISLLVQMERSDDNEMIQTSFREGGAIASSSLALQLSQSKGGGSPLPDGANQQMSNAFGTDFSSVNIHTDTKAVQMNRSLGARAFTHGNDMYFNQGEYKPESGSGKRLLAHELTHVVQQKGRGNSIQRKCDSKSALKYYKDSDSGKEIEWTKGLVEELFKVVGTANESLYLSAKHSGAIDANFVSLVCKAQEILGLTGKDLDGKIGTSTIAEWSKWKTGGSKGIDYTKLFKDKKLEIGIAVGYEFHDAEFVPIEDLLLANGLKNTSSTAKKKTYRGKKKFKVQGDNTAPDVEIEIIIDCISANSTGAKDTFGEFLTQKEIALYSGHARYGTGPDFDNAASVTENFVIGVNSALHKTGKLTKGYDKKKNTILKSRANDLEKLSQAGKFDPDLYQVWFLNACSSIHYLDEIRGGLVADKKGKKKSVENLRIMGTSKSIYSDALPIVQGLLKMSTMEEIIAAMNKYEIAEVKSKGEKPSSSYYFSD